MYRVRESRYGDPPERFSGREEALDYARSPAAGEGVTVTDHSGKVIAERQGENDPLTIHD